MDRASSSTAIVRRAVLRVGPLAALGVAAGRLVATPCVAAAEDADAEETALIKRLSGGPAALSPRVHLAMPPVFSNGYSVPMSLLIDSPMTDADYVRQVRIVTPRNPYTVAAEFRFTPQSGRAAVTTRIRLAEPQTVLAVAETSDGALLMARTWVRVDTNGCK